MTSWSRLEALAGVRLINDLRQKTDQIASGLDQAKTALRASLTVARVSREEYVDPADTFASALIAALEELIRDVAGAGGYQYLDYPKKPADVLPFALWSDRFAQSFYDTGDSKRPIFSESARIGGTILLAAAPSFVSMIETARPLAELFNLGDLIEIYEKIKKPAAKPSQAASRERDWRQWTFRDTALVENLENWALRQLTTLKNHQVFSTTVYDQYLEYYTSRVNQLLRVKAEMSKLIKLFGEDLLKTDLYQLTVPESAGGNRYFLDTFRGAQEPPGLSKNSYTVGVCSLGGAGTLAGIQNFL